MPCVALLSVFCHFKTKTYLTCAVIELTLLRFTGVLPTYITFVLGSVILSKFTENKKNEIDHRH
jgi:hypothetical protein